MKDRVDKGELLTDYDQEFLKEVAEEARFIPALLERQPQFKPLAAPGVFAVRAHHREGTRERESEREEGA